MNLSFSKVATVPATLVDGRIYFETSTGTIKIKGTSGTEIFGGCITDVEWTSTQHLKITKTDGTILDIDMSDVASASSLASEISRVEGLIDAVEAKVDAIAVPSVSSTDKILSMTDNVISSELALAYNATTKIISLTGKGGASIGTIDATAFIKDGMLDSAELAVNPEGQAAGTYLVLTFNTDSGSDPIYVDVTSLIDVYTAGTGITITGKSIAVNQTTVNGWIDTKIGTLDVADTAVAGQVVSAVSETDGKIAVTRRALVAADIPTLSVSKLSDLDATKAALSTAYATATTYTAPAAGDTVQTAISKLAKGVADATAAGVTSFGGQTGVITLAAAADGNVNLAMTGKQLSATLTWAEFV